MKLESLHQELALGSDVFKVRQSELEKTVQVLHRLKTKSINDHLDIDKRVKCHPKNSKRPTMKLRASESKLLESSKSMHENDFKADETPNRPKVENWSMEDLERARILEAQLDSYVARYKHVKTINLEFCPLSSKKECAIK